MLGKISLLQVNRFLFCGVLIVAILYFAQKVLIPLTFSVFFAMLFTPLSNLMENKGIKRVFSTLISVLIIILVVCGIGLLVYMQAKELAEQFPVIEKKSEQFFKQVQEYVSQKLNIPEQKQDAVINKQMKSGTSSVTNVIKDLLGNIAGIAGASVVVLIFTFLFLYQREKYESFFVQISTGTSPDEAKRVIGKIAGVAQNYLVGRALSVLIFTVLFSLGFLSIGLKNGFLLAFIAALLTIVPYIGSIVGGLFPFAIALVTEDSTNTALGALIVVVAVQAVDNYFIEPYVIGGEVNISGFFTILILLIGGLIWGVAGMVLFLPMLAVGKIVCDNTPSLKPYGYLIGDQQEEKQSKRMWNKLKKLFKK
jgi:predicted PurR-regulated permease PerM